MSNPSFDITMNWAKPFAPCETEEEVTLGELSIIANGHNLTRNVSTVAGSLRDSIKVSSFPLAVWFTTYWWRLLYEPPPSGEQISVAYNWKNAHELASANSGYVWPAISLTSDGKFVTIISSPQYDSSREPFFYLGSNEEHVVASNIFGNVLKSFITSTIKRLDDKLLNMTELHEIWEQLTQEMSDEDFSLYRRIEATLGYDPDEAPEKVIGKLKKVLKLSNENILTEISSVCSVNETQEPEKELSAALTMAKAGLKGKWQTPLSGITLKNALPPWDTGRLLARKLRSVLDNSNKKIDTKTLCDFLGITTKEATQTRPAHDSFTLSHADGDTIYVNFKHESSKYYTISRRFQLARVICSLLSASSEDIWFISSRCKTYTQRVQRAFAAEFLAPIDEVVKITTKNVTNESIVKAATYFSVSPQTIAHSLINQGMITKANLSNLYF